MSLVWDKKLFDELYDLNGEPYGHPNNRGPIRLHYNRSVIEPFMQRRTNMMMSLPEFSGMKNLIFIGGAYGWSFEHINGINGCKVITVDLSDHVVNTQRTTEEEEIREHITKVGLDPDRDNVLGPRGEEVNPLDLFRARSIRCKDSVISENMGGPRGRSAIHRALKDSVHLIVTEDVLTEYDDEGVVDILEKCESLKSAASNAKIIHQITLKKSREGGKPQDHRFNWKTVEEWNSLLDDNGFGHHYLFPLGDGWFS